MTSNCNEILYSGVGFIFGLFISYIVYLYYTHYKQYQNNICIDTNQSDLQYPLQDSPNSKSCPSSPSSEISI